MEDGPKKPGIDFYKTSKFDALLIGLVLFSSLIYIFWSTTRHIQRTSGTRLALIYQKDKLVKQAALDKDRTIALTGIKMKIEVKNGRIRVAQSDCPQRICMNMGWIKHAGQSIVCVPNKVVIEIKSGSLPIVDAVAY